MEFICTSVLNKDTLQGSDYCKGAILILSALQKLQPKSALTVLLQSAVEISEILYSNHVYIEKGLRLVPSVHLHIQRTIAFKYGHVARRPKRTRRGIFC